MRWRTGTSPFTETMNLRKTIYHDDHAAREVSIWLAVNGWRDPKIVHIELSRFSQELDMNDNPNQVLYRFKPLVLDKKIHVHSGKPLYGMRSV